jgi:hypothetical protein
MMRTIEEVLGVSQLSVHDSGVPPMTHVFDIDQDCSPKKHGGSYCWTYKATPAQILYTSTLPLPKMAAVNTKTLPHPSHDAAWWAAKTKGFDFSREDLNDPAAFNRILWEGLMGAKPYPTTRSGAEIRHSSTPQSSTNRANDPDGSM